MAEDKEKDMREIVDWGKAKKDEKMFLCVEDAEGRVCRVPASEMQAFIKAQADAGYVQESIELEKQMNEAIAQVTASKKEWEKRRNQEELKRIASRYTRFN